MKLWISLACAVVLLFTGAILWVIVPGSASEQLAGDKSAGDVFLIPQDQPQPKAEVVGGTRFDFGESEVNIKGKHVFKIKNNGQGTLVLKAGPTTCKCTFAGLDRTEVPPGETAETTVEWLPAAEDPKFAQSATIFTNDRLMPQIDLAVHGVVTRLWGISPSEVFMPSIPITQESKATLYVSSPASDSFQIKSVSFADASTAKYFDSRITPVDASKLAELQAKSAYELTIIVKPGLPLGRFQQRIRLVSDLPNSPEINAPIFGTVAGWISLVGDQKSWNEDTAVLTLGTVNPASGREFDMQLRVRGPHQDVKIEGVQVTPYPDVLQVKVVGPPEKARNGKVTSIPLKVVVPPGAPAVNCLGSGSGEISRVTIKTNHPETPELKLLVSFAVKGSE